MNKLILLTNPPMYKKADGDFTFDTNPNIKGWSEYLEEDKLIDKIYKELDEIKKSEKEPMKKPRRIVMLLPEFKLETLLKQLECKNIEDLLKVFNDDIGDENESLKTIKKLSFKIRRVIINLEEEIQELKSLLIDTKEDGKKYILDILTFKYKGLFSTASNNLKNEVTHLEECIKRLEDNKSEYETFVKKIETLNNK